jgi:AraC-like DNA-binding protein
VAPHERAEVLKEVAGRAVANLELTFKTNDLQVMEVETHTLPGGVALTGVSCSPLRSESYDLSRGDDDFTLAWSAAPSKGDVQQLGKELPASGLGALLSVADWMKLETYEFSSHTFLKLQRQTLCQMLPNAEALLMKGIPSDNTALQLLKHYVATYRMLKTTDPELARVVATHIADLVALAAGAKGDAAEQASRRGLRAAQLQAAKRWIKTRLTSPELSVNKVAAALKIHPRTVQLLFESQGETFSLYVQRKRLALARERLSQPGLEHRSVTEIAYDSGFGHLSHFTNSFRKTYGETPSSLRRRVLPERRVRTL